MARNEVLWVIFRGKNDGRRAGRGLKGSQKAGRRINSRTRLLNPVPDESAAVAKSDRNGCDPVEGKKQGRQSLHAPWNTVAPGVVRTNVASVQGLRLTVASGYLEATESRMAARNVPCANM
ncbi:MAG: hypothetical protein AUG89_01255 [Acidobacteria bacterium 13_1_20CM_4_56_7]|nr:MAG: hypothetical protein AUG89_01255 [Acidobacteria bacterium 13_1_20CM_4_56_7]